MRGRSRYSLNNRIDSMWPRWWFVSPRILSLLTMISFPSSRFERIVIVIVRYSNILNFENWIFEYAGILNTLFKLNSRRKIIEYKCEYWIGLERIPKIGYSSILNTLWILFSSWSLIENYYVIGYWIGMNFDSKMGNKFRVFEICELSLQFWIKCM